MTSELFPEPLTPVTAINRPKGKSTSMLRRLLCLAPKTLSVFPEPTRRVGGRRIERARLRNCPVKLFAFEEMSSMEPTEINSPPLTPGPGPKSTNKSAARIVSSSCSTTIRLLPISRNFLSDRSSFSLSRACRPIDGSSKTYNTPVRPAPI